MVRPDDRELSVGRAATPDEIGGLGVFRTGPDGASVTGGDTLGGGGVAVASWYCGVSALRHKV